jgi:hypothetical protein
MDLANLVDANTLTDKRSKLIGLQTNLQGTGQITVAGRDIAPLITAQRIIDARAALLPIIQAEITDTEAALAAIDLQV